MPPTVDVAMPPAVDLPADFATRSTVTYRIWFFTASDDPRGTKGDVSVCLHGALGSVWLQQLQEMRPSGTTRLGVIDADAHGGRCELFVAAQDVGTLQRVTVAYAHGGKSDLGVKPWKLSQILVRHGGDGVCTAFPASAELRPPAALLELMPRLSYHEDMWGNLLEAPPPPPPGGRWSWPAAPMVARAHALHAGDEAGVSSELEALQLRLYDAILTEELLPLADAALHDVTMMRTPGTFLFDVVHAAAGTAMASAAPGAMEALKKHSAKLQNELDLLSGKKDAKDAKPKGEAAAQARLRAELEATKLRVAELERAKELLEQQMATKQQMQSVEDEGAPAADTTASETSAGPVRSFACIVS